MTDISRYRLTGILDLSDKDNISVVDCSYNQITKITLSPSVKNVLRYNNQRAKLIIPGRIDCLDCSYNQLSELILPPGIKGLNCSYNQLSELILPPGIKSLDCRNNQITKLILPPGMVGVNCSNNPLIQLILPPTFIHNIAIDEWPLDDLCTRISLLSSSYADLVRVYYISHPHLREFDKLTMRNRLALLGIKQKWLNHYWRPNGPKSLKLMRESMQILCRI